TLTVSRERQKPASSIVNPTCIPKTRNAATSTQTVLIGLIRSDALGSGAAGAAGAAASPVGAGVVGAVPAAGGVAGAGVVGGVVGGVAGVLPSSAAYALEPTTFGALARSTGRPIP